MEESAFRIILANNDIKDASKRRKHIAIIQTLREI